MTRNPALRPTSAPISGGDLCAALKRIALTSAAGFLALFLATAVFWK